MVGETRRWAGEVGKPEKNIRVDWLTISVELRKPRGLAKGSLSRCHDIVVTSRDGYGPIRRSQY